ncbi:MAG: hypothetical protein VX642_01020 [Bdellovibrionota bacterium]|nr:hypothetical protein [Bdellovibrionota bacterium]
MSFLIRVLLIFIFSLSATIAQDSPPDPLLGIEQESRNPVMTIELLGAISFVANPIVSAVFGEQSPDFYISMQFFLATFLGVELSKVRIQNYFSNRRFNNSMKNDFEFDGRKIRLRGQDFYLEHVGDPFVIETISKPSSSDEYRANAKLIEEVLFNPSKNGGLGPALLFANMHIHIDMKSAFGSNPNKIGNFLVDLANHPGFYKGGLTQKYFTSGGTSISNFRQFAEIGRQLQLLSPDDVMGARKLLQNLSARKNIVRYGMAYGTLELRFPRAARSLEEFLNLLELVKRRVNYVNGLEPLELKAPEELKVIDRKENLIKYVTETGMGWEEFESSYKGHHKIRKILNFVKKQCRFSSI